MSDVTALHRQLGLTDDEFAAVVEELGREPTELELAMYAVMWSEHCSYKSSKRHLGRFPTEAPWRLVLAKAEGVDNVAVLLGSATGRDGIGGASVLASAGFAEGDEEKRPSIQVGDPFEEKRLIEACLELLDAGLAIGVQDLGAAGISCAASETAAKAGAGMDVDVARVAKREPGMNPVEIMTSESQERMLAIVEPAKLDAVLDLARRWEIRAMVVGRVTDTARFRVYE